MRPVGFKECDAEGLNESNDSGSRSKMQRCKRVTVIRRFKREGQVKKLDSSPKNRSHPPLLVMDQNRG